MKVCLAALDLFQTAGQTHMTKLKGAVSQLSLGTCQNAMRYTEAGRIQFSFLNYMIPIFERKAYYILTQAKSLSSPFA
jgi:hypothetical protein